MTISTTAAQLSDILGDCGFVSTEDFIEARQVSDLLSKPLPEVLIACGYVDSNLMNAALELTELMKEQLIDRGAAVKCLPKVASTGQSVKDVLRSLGWKSAGEVPSIRLGELLLDVKLISKGDFEQALAESRVSEIPVGQNLIKAGKIDSLTLLAALDVLTCMRDCQLPRQDALKALTQAKQRKLPVELLLPKQVVRPRQVKLGELLTAAGIVNSEAVLGAIEIGLFDRKKIGQVLKEQELVSDSVLSSALLLQKMVDEDQCSVNKAIRVLRFVHEQNCTVEQAMAQLGMLPPLPDLRLGVLLKQAGLLTEEQVEETLRLAARNQVLFGKMLLLCEFISKPALHAALECQLLVRENLLKADHGTIALNYCARMHCDLKQALLDLGYSDRRQQATPEVMLQAPA